MATLFLLWLLGLNPAVTGGPRMMRAGTEPLHPVIVRAHIVRRHLPRHS